MHVLRMLIISTLKGVPATSMQVPPLVLAPETTKANS